MENDAITLIQYKPFENAQEDVYISVEELDKR